MWGNWLYFETPDCNLISLNAKDGKERWRKQIADVKLEYFCTVSPLVVGNHIIAGVGGDSLDNPGYLESRDPETGAVQWHWNTEPKAGEPGAETWPDAEARGHGGGMTWMTGTYDPDLHLIYWGTGNPNPVHAGDARKGDNLWTCSIVALTGAGTWDSVTRSSCRLSEENAPETARATQRMPSTATRENRTLMLVGMGMITS